MHSARLPSLHVQTEQTHVPCAGKAPDKGGLALLFEMVLGGLVGTSPHMISASVMALARLLHQFANELGGKRFQAYLYPLHLRSTDRSVSTISDVECNADCC